MSALRPLALVTLLLCSGTALAAPASTAQIESIAEKLGFAATAQHLASNMAGNLPKLQAMDASRRECIVGEMGRALLGSTHRELAQAFQQAPTPDAAQWLTFFDTPSGQRFSQWFGEGMLARVQGQPEPKMGLDRVGVAQTEVFVDGASWKAFTGLIGSDNPGEDEARAEMNARMRQHCQATERDFS